MIKYKNSKGITLIAITLTIVVMMIIATITITASIKDEGLIDEAKNTGKDVDEYVSGTAEDMGNIINMISGTEED